MKIQKNISLFLILFFSLSSVYANYGDNYSSNVSRLNVRLDPNAKAKIVGELNKGFVVKQIDQNDLDWKKIELKNGVFGFVKSKYLVSYNENNNIISTTGTVKAGKVFIRTNPDYKSRITAIVKKGDDLEILYKNIINDNFIKVKITSGKYHNRTGFIAKKYLDILGKKDIEELLNTILKNNDEIFGKIDNIKNSNVELMIPISNKKNVKKDVDIEINNTINNIFSMDGQNMFGGKSSIEEKKIKNVLNKIFK